MESYSLVPLKVLAIYDPQHAATQVGRGAVTHGIPYFRGEEPPEWVGCHIRFSGYDANAKKGWMFIESARVASNQVTVNSKTINCLASMIAQLGWPTADHKHHRWSIHCYSLSPLSAGQGVLPTAVVAGGRLDWGETKGEEMFRNF